MENDLRDGMKMPHTLFFFLHISINLIRISTGVSKEIVPFINLSTDETIIVNF